MVIGTAKINTNIPSETQTGHRYTFKINTIIPLQLKYMAVDTPKMSTSIPCQTQMVIGILSKLTQVFLVNLNTWS